MMQENVNYERVGIRLANQLATVLYQNAVLETRVEELKQFSAESTPVPQPPKEGSDE